MKKPSRTADEKERLEVLESLNLVYSPAEECFDRITRLAQRLFNVPIALVSLVTHDKQWFKSASGLTVSETPRDVSFSGHAILQKRPLIIKDTHEDPDFADNPLVTGEPYVRFYAGQPLRLQNRAIGTLCLFDHRPRAFSDADIDSLHSLAAMVLQTLTTMAGMESGRAVLSEAQQALLSEIDQTEREILIDPPSKTWNRRGLEELLPRELALGARRNDKSSFIELRVVPTDTPFDELAKEEAATIIKEVAQRIRRSLRPYDLVARIDEATFAVFAPACSAEVSELLTDRIRSRVSDVLIDTGQSSCEVHIKAGIVSVEATDDASAERLVEVAELALNDAIEMDDDFVRYVV
jgi:diguanylate cyclase (GGDEF)-like protein|tara:strand:+ start:9905 stop:10960 length:1056 start_codon:yes stop_codon:yes gene_type:complete